MFRIELLPAAHGDALWVEYGDQRRPRRIVVDGGPAPTYEQGLRRRLAALPANDRRIDLFVVSHIDADHIDGAIILLREAEALGIRLGEVWFNGWPQLAGIEGADFQPLQGEFLGALLASTARIKAIWNKRAKGGPIAVPDEGALPSWDLGDDGRLTLLSPGLKQLRRLRARWTSAIRDFSPGDQDEALRRLAARREYRPPTTPAVFGEPTFGDDRAPANGSSIAFLLEHDGAACLLGADAHAKVLAAALSRLAQARNRGRPGPVRVDAVKLPHHGSLSNVNAELLGAIESRRWLVSTNGAIFGHPDPQTAELVAQLSPERPEFFCNYWCPTAERFADTQVPARWDTRYPGQGATAGPAGGIMVDLVGTRRRPATRVSTRGGAKVARRPRRRGP